MPDAPAAATLAPVASRFLSWLLVGVAVDAASLSVSCDRSAPAPAAPAPAAPADAPGTPSSQPSFDTDKPETTDSETAHSQTARSETADSNAPGLEGLARRQRVILPRAARQALSVVAPTWDSQEASLRRWERKSGKPAWRQVGREVPVVLGRAGLGCGRGLHDARFRCPVQKREGDKRAPAGLFALGTAFGRAPSAPYSGGWPYRPVTEGDYWVDAPESASYNTWQSLAPKAEPPWSAERLMMYSLALVVEHNTKATEPGAGSAIFFHPHRAPGTPTVGCTALDPGELRTLLSWLEPEARPVLLQTAGVVLD